MYDVTAEISGALVQHGQNNSRIYLMDIKDADPATLIESLHALALEQGYGKIFAKIPTSKADGFLKAGYTVEARAYGLYGGVEKGLFLGKFFQSEREKEALQESYQQVLSLAFEREEANISTDLDDDLTVKLCTRDDVPKMVELYGKVFVSYPFPIDNPSFIRASLSKDTLFAGLEKQGELIALASSECDFSEGHLYAEMTDFATLPSFRKNGYASKLLGFLEEQAKLRGIKTSYTIARAISKGMNITFRKAGYVYGGRLKNNTDISGNIESMNVWYKSLVDEKEAEN